MLWISEITQHFKKSFRDYDRAIRALKNGFRLEMEFSLSFPGGKLVVWKKVKTSNISGAMQPIFFIVSPSF